MADRRRPRPHAAFSGNGRGARLLYAAVAAVALLALTGCASAVDRWFFGLTGEESFPRQARGLAQLALNLTHPRPRLEPESPVGHSSRRPFGINVFLEQEVEKSKRELSAQMISGAGFAWVRQEFPWEDIEIHGKGDFEDRRHEPHRSAWQKYDHIVELADKYGLEILARLSNPPAWTRSGGDRRGTYAPPDSLDDWGDFVYEVASRYAGRLRYYQLWNEPNIYPEWGEQPVDPEAYTELLCEGYARIKEADSHAVVVSGALAPTVSLDRGPGPGLGMNEFVFLQRMYDAGAAECFDVLSVNDYMLWSGPTDYRMRPLNINFSRPAYVRDVMVANGDSATPVWISEMNSNAVPNDPRIHGWGAYGQVTLEQQARYAVLAYQRVVREWPWAGLVNFWFFKRASDAELNQAWYYFRMVEPDFTPLPVYGAIRSYTNGLDPVLSPGAYQEDHWALSYLGPSDGEQRDAGWGVAPSSDPRYGPTYRRAVSAGARMQLAFRGAGLELMPGPGRGVVQVVIDGDDPEQVELGGEAVLVTPRAAPVSLSRVRPVRHDVMITAIQGDVGVDGVRVLKPVAAWTWLGPLAGALIVGAIFVFTARQRRGAHDR